VARNEFGRNPRSIAGAGRFLVGTDNTIKFEHIDPNFKVRLEPDVILAAAEAMLNK
jgi:hypothetical protein